MRSLYFVILIFSVISCSSSVEKPEASRFKVSISVEGKEVEDFNQTLVHRISINKNKLNSLFGDNPEDYNCKDSLKVKKNYLKKPVGLIVRDGIDSLGLEAEDVLVSLGSKTLFSKTDFWHLKELIEIEKSAELTILRNSKANKVIYALDE